MIVDTATLATATNLSPSMVRRYAKRGTITPIRIHTGVNGRPTYWFDLDTSMTALAKQRHMPQSDH